jgi:hypothetical protein
MRCARSPSPGAGMSAVVRRWILLRFAAPPVRRVRDRSTGPPPSTAVWSAPATPRLITAPCSEEASRSHARADTARASAAAAESIGARVVPPVAGARSSPT